MFKGLSNIPIDSTYPLLKPLYLRGSIIRGFGRGSKLLGIPTANLPAEKFEKELSTIDNAVYLGWCSVGNEPSVYKTVLSIGTNPYFKDVRKTIVLKIFL